MEGRNKSEDNDILSQGTLKMPPTLRNKQTKKHTQFKYQWISLLGFCGFVPDILKGVGIP